MGGVSVAVAQAMRYAGCPNRRSLGVSEVFPHDDTAWVLFGMFLLPFFTGTALRQSSHTLNLLITPLGCPSAHCRHAESPEKSRIEKPLTEPA